MATLKRGTCPECGRRYKLRKDGGVALHYDRYSKMGTCRGTYAKPKPPNSTTGGGTATAPEGTP